MQTVPFKDIPVGSYFRSIYTQALFVRQSQYDALAVKMHGLTEQSDTYYEFDDHALITLLDCESEWPDIDYKPQIRGWNWEHIKANLGKFFKQEDGEPYATMWVGTQLGIMPSGKIYAFWTSNQTAQ